MTSLRMRLQSRWARGLIGLLTGAAVGLVVFAASRLSGPSLFVLAGAAAGGAGALVVHAYGRNAQLAEVKITVPQLSELVFVVNKDSQQVAWRLFVEIVTRVSLRPIAADAGLLREAMTSLYGLFETTRTALKQGQPSRPPSGGMTVEELAIAMLNRELRPFLSRWHPALRAWEHANPDDEAGWPQNVQCRTELGALQGNMRWYADGFASLAGLSDPERLMDTDTT